MAFSDPLFVAGTSKRVANSQTWAALRFSRLGQDQPGVVSLVPATGQVHGESRRRRPGAVAVAQAGQEDRAEARAVARRGRS